MFYQSRRPHPWMRSQTIELALDRGRGRTGLDRSVFYKTVRPNSGYEPRVCMGASCVAQLVSQTLMDASYM